MRFLLLTGMSGAGKTAAIRYLEDLGVFCVDNLPPMMISRFMEACEHSAMNHPAAAFAVDVRSGAFFNPKSVVDTLQDAAGYQTEIIFLDATDDILLDRYKETRREHPLSGEYHSTAEAIAAERDLLTPLREAASYIIDTSAMKPKALQKRLAAIVTGSEKNESGALRVQVVSFGFKRGIPREADLVWDVRFLPNPFYIPELCRHSGLDSDVRDFVLSHPVTQEFLQRTTGLLSFLLPHYQEEGKHRLVIAIGCTGGAHRSVAITEAVGKYLREQGYDVEIIHRDVEIEQSRWITQGN